VWIDREPSLLDGILGVAVRVTAPSYPGPDRLDQILQPAKSVMPRANMLQHPQLTVAEENPSDFTQALVGIGNRAKDQTTDDGVEAVGSERQLFSATDHQG